MSKSRNQDGLFVDTRFLRDHVSKLREAKKRASGLYDNVAAMKRCGDPAVTVQVDRILRDVGQLVEYFDRMAAFLDHVDDEAVRLSNELGEIIQDDTENLHRTISGNYML